MLSCPGFRTMSEAYAAIEAGADYLKLFPCEEFSPSALRAIRSALPPEAPPILCVGGIRPDTVADWLAAGACGVGVGGALFAPGRRSEEHTSELQSLMRISYAVFCLKKKTKK